METIKVQINLPKTLSLKLDALLLELKGRDINISKADLIVKLLQIDEPPVRQYADWGSLKWDGLSKYIDPATLVNWDTSKAISFTEMFRNCKPSI